MKPVDQTLFGDGKGNCFAACVASILELPLSEVPNFCAEHGDTTWWGVFKEWCFARGLAPLYAGTREDTLYLARTLPNVPWIAGGPIDDGVLHCTVWLGEAMVHDPNPIRRSGLAELQDGVFIVAARPSCGTPAVRERSQRELLDRLHAALRTSPAPMLADPDLEIEAMVRILIAKVESFEGPKRELPDFCDERPACNCDPLAQTGGGHAKTCPEWEPECSCYELTGGHMPGCYFNRNRGGA